MTFILRPRNLQKPELISLVTALAVVYALKSSTNLSPTIRWPNDVMVGAKKLGGILAEAQSYKQEITQILVGVGVNCNSPVVGIDPTGGDATSLIEELGKPIELSELKNSILDSFSGLYERWKAGENLAHLWVENVATVGKMITVKTKTAGNPFSCQALAIDPDGGLVVLKDGASTTFHSEDLEWLRENP